MRCPIMNSPIDWQRLAHAVSFYDNRGFEYLEVDWLIPEKTLLITAPGETCVMRVPGQGGLIGSAEQSLLHLHAQGKLGKGQFMACTPCFRNEAHPDHLHQKHFMKVELYQTHPVDEIGLHGLIETVRQFFRYQLPDPTVLTLEKTEDGWDLLVNGIEVGSYGIRRHGDMAWIYGTGLAEPRFSQAKHASNVIQMENVYAGI